MREYSVGSYGIGAYSFSQLFIELPLELFRTILLFLVNYWTFGFKGNFIYLVLIFWILSIASISLATMIGSTSNDVKSAMEKAPAVLVP